MQTVDHDEKFQDLDDLKESVRELLTQFRPYSPPDQRFWHDQIKSILSLIGMIYGFIPVPEYYVPSITGRNPKKFQRIDMVWNYYCQSDSALHPMIAFEIDPTLKSRSLNKLIAYDFDWKVQIGAGCSAEQDRKSVESRLNGTGIEFIIVKSTDNYQEFMTSFTRILDALIFEPNDLEGSFDYSE